MNRVVRVYTELDSLYDTRRGTIQNLLIENKRAKGENIPEDKEVEIANSLWEDYLEENYLKRSLDTFNFKDLGIDRETFKARYDKRSIKDWKHYYPTNLTDRLVKLIMDVELIEEKPIDISKVELTVNTYPFNFDDDINKELIGYLKTALNNLVEIKLMSFDVSTQSLVFYKNFDYVFKYDLLNSEDTKLAQESIGEIKLPELKLVIPDILVKDLEAFKGEVGDRIHAFAVLMSPNVTILPVKHEVYDYRK